MAERPILALLAVCTAAVVWVTAGDCGSPPQLENGSPTDEFISSNTFPVGAKLAYRCDPGYTYQEGSSRFITCREDSTWTALRATCEPRSCGNPGEIPNGYYEAADATFGKNATFHCNKGYRMVGRPYRMCTAEGWDGQVPTCEIVTCPDPPSIDNGRAQTPPHTGNLEYGMVVQYSCIDDFSLIGEKGITCTATGQWDKDPPTCKFVECQGPELPTHIRIISGFGPKYKYRDSITYRCNAGYEMVGNSVIECKSGCGAPKPIDNGELVYSSTAYYSRVRYSCYPGYVLSGTPYQTCTYRGWQGKAPKCEPRTCGNPGEVLNGYYDAPSAEFGSKVAFYCDTGFRITGRSYRLCTVDGWDGQVPTCDSVTCAHLPPINNGRAPTPPNTGNWEYAMVAAYSCFGDYSLIGAEELVCTATGQWDKAPPICEAVHCNRPEMPSNGQIAAGFGHSYKYRETITYRCDHGFEMLGNSIIECTENSEFLPPPPTCKLSGCHQPKKIISGRIQSSEKTIYALHDSITYECNKGFEMVGNNVIECMENHTFVPPPPSCEEIVCLRPKIIASGEIRPFKYNFKYGERIHYSCNTGFVLVGARDSVCKEGGNFVPSPPSCQKVVCSRPRNIANGEISPFKHDYEYGERIRYSCITGFELVGDRDIVCEEDGNFVPPPPYCRKVFCSRPNDIANGKIISPRYYYEYGEHIRYSCNLGYELVGARDSVCKEGGIFVPSPPSCQKVRSPTISIRVMVQEIIALGHQIADKIDINIKAERDLLAREREILTMYEQILQKMEQFVNNTNIF